MKSIITHKRQSQWLLLGFLMALFLALAGCDQQPQQQGPMPAPAVSVIDVITQPVGDYQEFVARTEAVNTVDLRARVEGFLTKRNFIEGETVKEGQLLFEIDQKPYEAALKKTEADLASAKAERTRTEKDLKRSQDLFRKGHISQADLDAQTSNQLRADASVQAAEAGLETARLNLGYTSIHAPFAGQVGRASYSVGNLVVPSSGSLATLTSIDPIYVTFQVDERQVVNHLMSSGGKRDDADELYSMRLRLPNGAEYNQSGSFNFADTQIDQTTGTLTLRSEFPNPHGIIVPGLYVTMIMESNEKADQPVIPQSAIQENQGGRFVLIVNNENQVETRQVEMGRRIGPFWAVNSGLKAGEQIIVEGLQKVRQGVKVQPNLVSIDPETGGILMQPQANNNTQQGN